MATEVNGRAEVDGKRPSLADQTDPIPTALILSGGLALGAYQAGVIAGLVRSQSLSIEAVAGSSIGAFNAAILAGSPPQERSERLIAFWQAVATDQVMGLPYLPSPPGTARHLRNWGNALTARLLGVPGLFWVLPSLQVGRREGPGLYDNRPSIQTLSRFADFRLINEGPIRCCIAGTDVQTGQTVFFDTAAGDRIAAEHIRASAGLMPSFPPVRIGKRLIADGGLSANAPLERFLSSARREPVPRLCILIDLFSAAGPVPTSFEAAAERSNDLLYGSQTGVRLEGIVRERALEARAEEGAGSGSDLVQICYPGLSDEAGSEKVYDFSRDTLLRRVRMGERDAQAALQCIARLPTSGSAGLRIHRVAPIPIGRSGLQNNLPLPEERAGVRG